jgi:hypothetical protein
MRRFGPKRSATPRIEGTPINDFFTLNRRVRISLMLKPSMRSRSLHTPDVTDEQVNEAIEGLLRGDKVADLPNYLCKSVITTMTQERKDALLRREEALAAKMDDVLGELQRGPNKWIPDTAREPNLMRSLTFVKPTDQTFHINSTTKQLGRGVKLDTFSIPDRQNATPTLKTKRSRVVSRANYPKSKDVDFAVDRVVEFELDSRRIGPRLLKVQDLEKQLENARAAYEAFRERCRNIRLESEAIRADAEEKMDEKLDQAMLDYGSHVPISLPLEFSKFSARVLDTRTKEQKSAHFKRYDDAAAFRGDAVKKEKDELKTCTERFARSFNLQKARMVTIQEQKRTGFHDHWRVKKEQQERLLTKHLMELRRAVEHLERDLAEAQNEADTELKRIKNNDRILNATPVLGRPASTQRRF